MSYKKYNDLNAKLSNEKGKKSGKGKLAIFMATLELIAILSGCNLQHNTPIPTSEPTKNPKATETPGEMPSQTATPIVTPTPTETVVQLTEAEKMFNIWLESAKELKDDAYANLVATKAYYNGELTAFIEKNHITDEDIEIMLNANEFFKSFYYPVTDNILSENYNIDDLSPADLAIAILRGDSVKATGDQLEDAAYALASYPVYGYSLVSALPEESREAVYDLIDIFYDMVDVQKDVSNLEETFNSYNLDWRQKWYVLCEFMAYPGISPEVTYNGERIQLGEYFSKTNYMGDFMIEVQDILAENYLADQTDVVDFFNVKTK